MVVLSSLTGILDPRQNKDGSEIELHGGVVLSERWNPILKSV